MGCARDLEQPATPQGIGHFLLRDGHDRGTSWVTPCVKELGLLLFHTNAGIHRQRSV